MQVGAEVYLRRTRSGMVVQTDQAVPPSFTYEVMWSSCLEGWYLMRFLKIMMIM